jgi:hypothetical protein
MIDVGEEHFSGSAVRVKAAMASPALWWTGSLDGALRIRAPLRLAGPSFVSRLTKGARGLS